jgi:hypothetical protein
MRVLIAVISYSGDADRGCHDAIRQTWGKDVAPTGADLRFFIGHRRNDFVPASDEVLVTEQTYCTHDPEVCKDQIHIQFEVREILRWSVSQGYDFTFLPSTDTFLIPSKLMTSGFEKYDYSGFIIPPHIPVGTKSPEEIYGAHLYPWADAGVGWFMSKKAAEIVATSDLNWWTDDIGVAQTLGPYIERKELTAGTIPDFWNSISWHYRWVTGKAYDPASGWMKNMYVYDHEHNVGGYDAGA